MNIEVITYLVVCCTYLFFMFKITNKNSTTEGPDMLYHNLLIKEIRNNGRKFITYHTNLINETRTAYPQLIHWLISHLNLFQEKWVKKHLHILTYILQLMFLILTLGVFIKFNLLKYNSESSFLIIIILFITIPFTYNPFNSKNLGLSIRSLGLLLGQIVLVLHYLYLNTNNVWFLGISLIIGSTILRTSQFASQFFIFHSILLSIFFFDYKIIIELILSFFIFFIISPKIFKFYFQGQFNHKYIYLKKIAKSQLFSIRRSIWLDLLWPIPKRLFNQINNFDKKSYDWEYIRQNSVVIVLLEIPLFLALISLLFGDSLSRVDSNFIKVGLLLFVLFSLRPTRFLGEPERYLEFFFILFPVFIYKYIDILGIYGVLSFSIIISFINIRALLNGSPHIYKDDELAIIAKTITKKSGTVLLCNGFADGRYFQDKNCKLFLYLYTMIKFDGLTYKDAIGQTTKSLDQERFRKVFMNYSEINTLILNKKYWHDLSFMKNLLGDYDTYLESKTRLVLRKISCPI